MAVILRLARHGKHKNPFYRIVAAESSKKRDGRYVEVIGTYNPKTNPATVTLKEEKVKKWVATGAEVSESVRSIIEKLHPGLVKNREEAQRKKIQAARKKRKARLAGKTDAKKAAKKSAKTAKKASAKKTESK